MKSLTLKLLIFLFIAVLSACDSQPVKPEQKPTEKVKPATEKQVSLSEEAERLLELAEDSDSEEEEFEFRALAARLYIEASDIRLAQEQLELLKEKASNRPATDEINASTETAEILLISAEIAIHKDNALLAGQLINEIKAITRKQQINFFSLKADLDFLSTRYMHAVDRRVQLDTYITNSKTKSQNNKKIWAALSNLSNTQLNNQRSNNATINGWLDLGKVMRTGQQNISKLEDDLLNWGTRHPAHPVNDGFLEELISLYQFDVSHKKQIAVLLPMSGKLSNITTNIKNGLLSAYYNDANTAIKPEIRFYDSNNKNLTFNELYQQALADGATNIIGPLDKVVINQLSQQRELDIPILTLNYAENEFNNTYNLYQFGLSPEDEARQVAELAVRQNKLRAAVFYPDSEWGNRLSHAFTEHFTLLGGQVLASADYAINTNDYKRPIRQLLNLDQSGIRRRKVENLIGVKTQSEAHRRDDIDMIFLAATHRSARSIMPSFKFHHAGNLPVYSTSHIYTGKINRELDRDLNGIIFCDLPWILQNNSSLATTFKNNWPQQQNFTRLFALGIDAYHLISNLDYLKNKEYAFYAGQTGNIQLDENNRVTRKLLWAKFVRGKPVYFEPAAFESAALAPTGSSNTP